MQLLQTAQGPSLASCLSTNSLTKLSLHRFTANSPLRTLVFLRRTMSPDPRVCASDMSHVRGPRQPMWIFASWSDFETDATAISILEPPGPRVQNIYSTFVDQITSSHVTPIEIVLVFPHLPTPRSMFLVRNSRYRWAFPPNGFLRPPGHPRAQFTHHSLGPRHTLAETLLFLEPNNLNWTTCQICPWNMMFSASNHPGRARLARASLHFRCHQLWFGFWSISGS